MDREDEVQDTEKVSIELFKAIVGKLEFILIHFNITNINYNSYKRRHIKPPLRIYDVCI